MATKSLYVGNMSYSTSEGAIRELFEPYGPIESVRVIGEKGFAFVDIPAENAQAAIDALNGQTLMAARSVNEARPRPTRRWRRRLRNRGGSERLRRPLHQGFGAACPERYLLSLRWRLLI